MRLSALPLLVLVLTACPSSKDAGEAQSQSAAPASNAPAFSDTAAFEHVKTQVAFGPRMPGSPGHAKQLAWMTQFLKERADTLAVQSFSVTTSKGKKLELTNLFARFNPTASDRVLLITHWDTRPTADQESDSTKKNTPILGADDGASGTAVLMQIAEILKKNKAPIGVDLLFVDGEDWGPEGTDMYLGAKYFAANLPAGYKPLYGILIDMIGDQNPIYPIEDNSSEKAPEVVDRVWRTAESIGLGNYFPRSHYGYIEDDHLALNQAGIHTADIIDLDYPYWHTTGDTLEHVSPQGLGVVGKVLLSLIFAGG